MEHYESRSWELSFLLNQFYVVVSFVLPMYGMLQVWTCLELPALKKLRIVDWGQYLTIRRVNNIEAENKRLKKPNRFFHNNELLKNTSVANRIKLFTAIIYGFCNKLVFVPWKPFQAGLMFVGWGQRPTLEWSTWKVGSGLTRKHQTGLDRLVRDKNSSLLRKVVTYDRKKICNIGSWCAIRHLGYLHSLIIFWNGRLVRGLAVGHQSH